MYGLGLFSQKTILRTLYLALLQNILVVLFDYLLAVERFLSCVIKTKCLRFCAVWVWSRTMSGRFSTFRAIWIPEERSLSLSCFVSRWGEKWSTVTMVTASGGSPASLKGAVQLLVSSGDLSFGGRPQSRDLLVDQPRPVHVLLPSTPSCSAASWLAGGAGAPPLPCTGGAASPSRALLLSVNKAAASFLVQPWEPQVSTHFWYRKSFSVTEFLPAASVMFTFMSACVIIYSVPVWLWRASPLRSLPSWSEVHVQQQLLLNGSAVRWIASRAAAAADYLKPGESRVTVQHQPAFLASTE